MRPELPVGDATAKVQTGDETAIRVGKDAPYSRLPQYTVDEVERGIEVIQLLLKVRDRCRAEGLIDW